MPLIPALQGGVGVAKSSRTDRATETLSQNKTKKKDGFELQRNSRTCTPRGELGVGTEGVPSLIPNYSPPTPRHTCILGVTWVGWGVPGSAPC